MFGRHRFNPHVELFQTWIEWIPYLATCYSFQTWFNSLFIDSLSLISCSVSTTWTEDRACSCHCQWSKEPNEITHILGNIFNFIKKY
jgi:hypothetical protein